MYKESVQGVKRVEVYYSHLNFKCFFFFSKKFKCDALDSLSDAAQTICCLFPRFWQNYDHVFSTVEHLKYFLHINLQLLERFPLSTSSVFFQQKKLKKKNKNLRSLICRPKKFICLIIFDCILLKWKHKNNKSYFWHYLNDTV